MPKVRNAKRILVSDRQGRILSEQVLLKKFYRGKRKCPRCKTLLWEARCAFGNTFIVCVTDQCEYKTCLDGLDQKDSGSDGRGCYRLEGT